MKINLHYNNVRAASAWKNPHNNLTLGLLAAASFLILSSMQVHAQSSWTGNSGNSWLDAGNWSAGIPSGTTEARFTKDASVTISGAATSGNLTVRPGTVSLTLDDGASLTSTSVNIGTTGGVGIFSVGTSDTNSGTFTLNRIYIGYSAGGDGSSAAFSGSGLSVNAANSRSIVGSSSSDNNMTVEGGAAVSLHSLRLGSDNLHGNTLTVAGADSSLSILSDTLDIGAANAYDNKLYVQNGGVVSVAQALNIGRASGSYSNQLIIGGSNAKLTMTAGAAIQVGQNTSPSNLGNNLIRVDAGGILETDGNIGIYGYDSAAMTSYGRNALLVNEGGTVIQTGARQITIGNDALLQLAPGGSIQSPKIQVSPGGRFEAEGSGVSTEALIDVQANGTLAVGLTDQTTGLRTGAGTFTLQSEATFASGGRLEFTIFGEDQSEADHITLSGVNALLSGTNMLILNLGSGFNPESGSWSLLTGTASNITAAFDLGLVSTNIWDLSQFNQAGDWTVTAISATNLYWTANGNTLGGAGTWSTNGANWTVNEISVDGAAWNATKRAVFTNDAATVTVDAVAVQKGILFTTAGYTLNDGTITLGGADIDENTVTANTNVIATINSVLDGVNGFTKAGAGTLVLGGDNTFSGGAVVSAGTLELKTGTGSALGSATSVTVGTGATLLLSKSEQVNNFAAVTLSGGTIKRAGGVSETFGDLNLADASFLDYGTGDTGTLAFGTYTPSALLTVGNFFEGNVLVFSSDLSESINNGSLFSFDNGFTTNWNGSIFTITAIPEPSACVAAAGLIGLMFWSGRRRLVRRT